MDQTMQITMPNSSRELYSTGPYRLMRCRRGLMLFNRNDLYIGKSLEKYGEFSEFEVLLFEQMVRAGAVVVEAGANIGCHTVALAQRVGPSGRVIAFEPQRLVHQTLCANLANNGLTNVDARRMGLGSHPGRMTVPDLDPHRVENFGGVSLGQAPVEGHAPSGDTVPVVTLDSLELTTCQLLKIDVESMELDVLQGGEQMLAACRPLLYVENDRADQSPALIEWLLTHRYRLYWHLPTLFNSQNFAGDPENIFPGVVSVNMLGIPAEFHATMDGFTEILGPDSNWSTANR
jgi:FkbM family methyltransferase